MDPVVDALRVVNVVIASWVMIRMVEQWFRKRKKYDDYEKITWNALFGGAVTALSASIENLLQDNPWGPRIFLTLVYLIFSVWRTYKRDRIDRGLPL